MVKKKCSVISDQFPVENHGTREVRWSLVSCSKGSVIQRMRFGAGTVKIGILAVQGDFEAHAAMLARLGAETAEVRTTAHLEGCDGLILPGGERDRKSTRLNSSHLVISYAVFCLKKKKQTITQRQTPAHAMK